MILARTAEGLLVVRQTDHGSQTGAFAAAWGNEEVAPPRRHAAAQQLAATHHDDGWALWERRPTLDEATGQPVQFVELTPREHVPLYRAGIARAAELDPWAGLLVSMHGSGLYNDRYGTFRLAEQHFDEEEARLVAEFLADMADLQDRLFHRATGHAAPGRASSDPEVRGEYLLLQVWDRLSLQYAYRSAASGVISPLPGGAPGAGELVCEAVGPMTLRLDPYPFAEDAMVFPLAACVVEDRPYPTPEAFLEAVRDAGERVLECRAVAAQAPRRRTRAPSEPTSR